MKTPSRPPLRQQGTILLIFAFMLTLMLGFIGLALDLGLFYLRKTQLQNAADSIALAAAQKLDGTDAGMTAAATRADEIARTIVIGAAGRLAWQPLALKFSRAAYPPAADWKAAGATGGAVGIRFVRVDTRVLADEMHLMRPVLMGVISNAVGAVELGTVAVAGPAALKVTPLAICAMSPTPVATRSNSHNGVTVPELVSYGFRHGVGYNLLKLNPATDATAGDYFLVDPINGPGTASRPITDAMLTPFMCSGTLAYPVIGSGMLHLRRPGSFGFHVQLNSRFGTYGGSPACIREGALPDRNVKDYSLATGWMDPKPTLNTAQSVSGTGKPLDTIAEAATPVAASAPGNYGIRWAYGPARTPAGAAIGTASAATLYPSSPAMTTFSPPALFPYKATGASNTMKPAGMSRPNRRVLYIPLLACPGAGSAVDASVLAIGRFFLTAPASATEVPGEFAGIADEAQLATAMELYQ